MYKISKRSIAIFLMALFSFVIAVEQPFGYSPDFTQYEFFFQQVRFNFSDTKLISRFEPGFFYISALLTQILNSNLIIYGLFVFTAILIKFNYGLRNLAGSYFWIAIVFYLFKYFPLHELTQLRAALGASFMIAAFFYTDKGKYKQAVFAIFIASMFHYSALMLAPFLFLPRVNRKQAILIAASIFGVCFISASYVTEFLGKSIIVFQSYGDYETEKKFSLFSPVFFPEYFIIFTSIYYWEKLTETMRKVVIIEMIGFSIYYAFIDYSVIAVRGREFFSILWIFFVAQGSVSGSKVRLGINIFVVTSIIISIYLFFASNFFTAPSKWVD